MYWGKELDTTRDLKGNLTMNPWEEISLSDHGNHMSLDSVKQLQAMNEMMNKQFAAYPVTTFVFAQMISLS